MSRRTSAGVLLYRYRRGELEVLLAHPGGPFFANRDLHSWTIPKGEPAPGDGLLETALREFEEETGHAIGVVALDPTAPPRELGSVLQANGKRVHGWAVEGDLDPGRASSNTFDMPWPPSSDHIGTFLEIDRVAWFGPAEARRRANRSQVEFIDRLETLITQTQIELLIPRDSPSR